MRNRFVALAIASAAFVPGSARAEDIVLDYSTTIRIAAERAPAVVAARGRIGEARGRRAGARVRPDPELEVAAGARSIDGDRTIELDASLWQELELGGRRGARIGVADAELAAAEAHADDAARLAIRDAGLAYVGVLAAELRVQLAADVEAVAATIAQATDRRLARGDVLELDAGLARSALGRARAAVRAAEADREAALTRRTFELDRLLASAGTRPELRELEAERRAGRAQARLGGSARWPELKLGVAYAREERAQIVVGGLAITLPLFERGQGDRHTGRARASRAVAEKDALARSVLAQVRAAHAAHQKRVEAVDEYERNVNPLLDETDRVLRKGYEAGTITLADYLVARRELLDARAEYVDRLLDAATAAVEVDAAAGVTP
jgi:cobalt-zinc-cadmium efflux system outer membrane protein